MILRSSLALLAIAASLLAGCGSAPPAPVAPTVTTDGVLTAKNGLTLYTFDRDSAGKSVCNDKCAANWPPLLATSDAAVPADYSVITRDDGSKQYAYKGKPLYFWAKDTKAGDKTGDGFNKVWHAATP